MSIYFTLPSFARAKKHTEELRQTQPTKPILRDEDEKFLERKLSGDNAIQPMAEAQHTKIFDNGDEEPVTTENQREMERDTSDVVVPADTTDPAESAREPAKPSAQKNLKKSKMMDLPSQEEAEKATQGWDAYMAEQKASQPQDGKRTWVSYLPNALQPTNKQDKDTEANITPNTPAEDGASQSNPIEKRTWTKYASSYVLNIPGMPSLPSLASLPVPDSWLPKPKPSDPDSQPHPILNPDGTVNEPATRAQQEREISVLLDNLNMSTINDRVFALSAETQRTADRFAQVLRDTLNGVPTAYDDMETFLREAGPSLERQFKALPGFVQTLVKSLPAKLGAVLAPEILVRSGTGEVDGDEKGKAKGKKGGKRKRRYVPSLRSLLSKEGAIAGMLRAVVRFIEVRFPFFASATNVVLSLSITILMFVFWYCHKRGRELRLAREAAEGEELDLEDAEDDDDDAEDSDDTENDDEKVNDRKQQADASDQTQKTPAYAGLQGLESLPVD